jgi:hypothetical protein
MKLHYDKQPSILLAYSGSLFVIPATIAWIYGNILTAVLNGLLSGTSIWYHLYRTDPSFILDQIILYSVVIRGFFDGYSGGIPGLAIWFSTIGYNYVVYFSPIRHHLIQHPDIKVGDRWHASMHLVSLVAIASQQLFIEHPSS